MKHRFALKIIIIETECWASTCLEKCAHIVINKEICKTAILLAKTLFLALQYEVI